MGRAALLYVLLMGSACIAILTASIFRTIELRPAIQTMTGDPDPRQD